MTSLRSINAKKPKNAGTSQRVAVQGRGANRFLRPERMYSQKSSEQLQILQRDSFRNSRPFLIDILGGLFCKLGTKWPRSFDLMCLNEISHDNHQHKGLTKRFLTDDFLSDPGGWALKEQRGLVIEIDSPSFAVVWRFPRSLLWISRTYFPIYNVTQSTVISGV
jgi:hypothetical protein